MRDPAPLRERLIFESASFHVSHQLEDEDPTYLGALLIQTKRRTEGLAELTDTEGRELGWLIQ
jgi:diadenosine tetraphosphate (Ap4A) HIT family hydrolase